MRKLILAAAITSAFAFSSSANADGSYASIAIYDFYNSDISIKAGTTLNDKISIHGQYIDALDYVLRATGEYELQDNFFALAGVSHYDSGFSDDSGVIIGAGYRFNVEGIPLNVKASYDSAIDGFFSVEASARYNFTDKLSVEAGYRVNTNSVNNEFGFGVRLAF